MMSFYYVIYDAITSTSKLFHDGGCYHVEISPLICGTNQWTGYYMITASVMKELIETWLIGFLYLKVCAAIISTAG